MERVSLHLGDLLAITVEFPLLVRASDVLDHRVLEESEFCLVSERDFYLMGL